MSSSVMTGSSGHSTAAQYQSGGGSGRLRHRGGRSGLAAASSLQQQQQNQQEAPIFTTRPVDWPMASKLPLAAYAKLLQQARRAGQQQLGAYLQATSSSAAGASSTAATQQQQHRRTHSGAAAAAAQQPQQSTTTSAATATGDAAATAETTTTGGGATSEAPPPDSSNSNYLSSLMSRVLSNPAGATSSSTAHQQSHGAGSALDDLFRVEQAVLQQQEQFKQQSASASQHMRSSSGSGITPSTADSSASSTTTATHRWLRPPRPHCVAAANGWIVACVECPPASGSSSTSTTTTMEQQHPGATLRLVSRWNVRRGATAADQFVVLPPPVPVGSAHDSSATTSPTTTATATATAINQVAATRIVHVFCDPTGSHTLLSAANGECYYLHGSGSSVSSSTSNRQQSATAARKLAGFGPPTATDSFSTARVNLTGVTAVSVAHQSTVAAAQARIQQGLSPDSHVTAVAWDRERGTEGHSKTVLLGTSAGEIYEYSLSSGGSDGGSSSEQQQQHKLPVLLHRLYRPATATADPSEVGAAVTGLYTERLRTGLLVLAATSGRHKRTRFYTFYSAHSSSLRHCLADQQHAVLQELPGSVDFANLVLCGDHFALRTQTGIYYGTLDRSLTGPAVLSGGSSIITESGILPYESTAMTASSGAKHHHHRSGSSSSSGAAMPVSLALTPHHIVTLHESAFNNSNEVRFLNRVAQKCIQKERIDIMLGGTDYHPHGGSDSILGGAAHGGEFMMDIRRPDQIWLRKGRSLVHISAAQEDRDVWKFTLRKGLELRTTATSSTGQSSKTTAAASAKGQSASSLLMSSSAAAAASGSVAAQELTDEEKAQEALFEQAKTLCTNASQKAVVTAVRAEYHLQHGRGELAAKYLSQCPASLEQFADTAIRLALPKLGIDDPQSYGGSLEARACLEASNLPLITYLNEKMRVGSSNDDKMTCTMIGAWLTELFLHERGDQVANSDRVLLAQFLNANVHQMDAKTIMKILTSHDVGAAECAAYAAQSGDIKTAVNAALSVGHRDSVRQFRFCSLKVVIL